MPSDSAARLDLCLVRHAHAAWATPGLSDFDRSLDVGGVMEARDVAEQARAAGIRPDLIISSPARRCRETTAALRAAFGDCRMIEDAALYSGGADVYLAHIAQQLGEIGSLMIVGHNPMIEALAHHLVPEGQVTAAIAMGYPTAGMLAIAFPAPLPQELQHAGEAVRLITPSLT